MSLSQFHCPFVWNRSRIVARLRYTPINSIQFIFLSTGIVSQKKMSVVRKPTPTIVIEDVDCQHEFQQVVPPPSSPIHQLRRQGSVASISSAMIQPEIDAYVTPLSLCQTPSPPAKSSHPSNSIPLVNQLILIQYFVSIHSNWMKFDSIRLLFNSYSFNSMKCDGIKSNLIDFRVNLL